MSKTQFVSTHQLTRTEAYYSTSPMQGRSPEGNFEAGTGVVVIGHLGGGSYTRVSAESGVTAWVASDALKPLKRPPASKTVRKRR